MDQSYSTASSADESSESASPNINLRSAPRAFLIASLDAPSTNMYMFPWCVWWFVLRISKISPEFSSYSKPVSSFFQPYSARIFKSPSKSGPVLPLGRTVTMCRSPLLEIQNLPQRSSITKHIGGTKLARFTLQNWRASRNSKHARHGGSSDIFLYISSPNWFSVAEIIASGAEPKSRAVC